MCYGFKVFFKNVFAKHTDALTELNVNANQGISDLENRIAGHANEAEIKVAFSKQRGRLNFHLYLLNQNLQLS